MSDERDVTNPEDMTDPEETDKLNRTRRLPRDTRNTVPERVQLESTPVKAQKPVPPIPVPPNRFAQRNAPSQVGGKPLAPRARSRGGVMPPLWSFLLMILLVIGAVFGVVMLVLALGGRTPVGTQPQLVILTAAPEQFAQSGVTILASATIPAQFAPTNLQPQSTFMMAGPTLPPPQISPTPETVDIGKTIIVIDVGDQQLNVRDRPGIQTSIVFRAPESETFLITDGPVQADGLTWWRIQDPNNGARAGWAAANYLQAVPSEGQ